MTVKQKTYYPSPRIKALSETMDFVRNPDWHPGTITIDVLKMLNIAPSKETQIFATLKFLELITDSGLPTEYFNDLKDNYSDTLNTIVKKKYSDVFNMIPNDLINQDRIVNFFMNTSGTSRDTAEYQGMAFGWLCREAGIELLNLLDSFKRARFNKKKK